MLKITNLTEDEAKDLLQSLNFGHLGCSRNDQPYIVPMHYALDNENIYFLTTEGMKSEWLDGNPKVCFQIEKVTDERHWQSVIVMGLAERLTTAEEIGRAADYLFKKHPTLTPALNRTIVHGEEKFNGAVIYRVRPDRVTGRKTARS